MERNDSEDDLLRKVARVCSASKQLVVRTIQHVFHWLNVFYILLYITLKGHNCSGAWF